jgi:hypothetical protein
LAEPKLKYFVPIIDYVFGTNTTPTKFPSKETVLEHDELHPNPENEPVQIVEPSKRVKPRLSRPPYKFAQQKYT